jgi:hypothetical protein
VPLIGAAYQNHHNCDGPCPFQSRRVSVSPLVFVPIGLVRTILTGKSSGIDAFHVFSGGGHDMRASAVGIATINSSSSGTRLAWLRMVWSKPAIWPVIRSTKLRALPCVAVAKARHSQYGRDAEMPMACTNTSTADARAAGNSNGR